MDGPNKLECLRQASLSGLVLFNTLAYCAHSQVSKKQKGWEHGPCADFLNILSL